MLERMTDLIVRTRFITYDDQRYVQMDGSIDADGEQLSLVLFIRLPCGRYSNMLERKRSLKHDEAVQRAIQR